MFKTKRIYLLNQRNLTRHPCKSLKKKREYDFFSKTFFLRNKKALSLRPEKWPLHYSYQIVKRYNNLKNEY